MFGFKNRKLENRIELRCVWVPAHLGTHAPLTAVWIVCEATAMQAPEAAAEEQGATLATDDPDWLPCAA